MESIRVLCNIGTKKNRRLLSGNAEVTGLSKAARESVLLEGVLCYGRLLKYEKLSCGVQLFKHENGLKFLRSPDCAKGVGSSMVAWGIAKQKA